MKNLAIFGLAAASAAMAAPSLWSMDADAYQVQVPETVVCDKTGEDYGKACYESTGGWWFAYVGDENKGQTMSFDPIANNDDGTYKLITTDPEDGSIIDGGNLIAGTGLRVTMSAAGGASSDPAIAGIGFNWTKVEDPIDISAHPGYCIVYSWDGSQPLQMELGWKEDKDKGGYGYDTWYAKLPAQTALTKLDLPWSAFAQDKWDKPPQPITVAQTEAVSLKIRLKNATAAEVKGTLTISELGWTGECGEGGQISIGSIAKAASVKATLSGRTLSFSGVKGAAKAEILNLQGQVVLKGSTASAMNLAGLDAGVYMVRVAGANLTQKILLK
jgi:hypothetical protein